MERAPKIRSMIRLAAACAVIAGPAVSSARGDDVSKPAMIQFFESTWTNMSRRAPDLFMAGYGQVWIPPAFRSDSGSQSVGYDVYDRFDLGSADRPTLYGTENTLKRAVGEMRKAGLSTYADLVWNHNGFKTYEDSFFGAAGGYPGFVPGDFHALNINVDNDPQNGRTSGLIDIAHEANNSFVRNPVPGASNNIPAGTTPQFGRLANVASEANRRFYQDRNRAPDRYVNGTPMWNFTPDSATTGDPIAENATGYLMRHTQWMLQEIGVDGFRLDATKHMPQWVLNDFFDVAVNGANPRRNLDDSAKTVFSFGENFDTNKEFLQTYIRKDGSGTTIRDTKDFPLYYALQNNLKSNGIGNDWRNVVTASVDSQDGYANNGSQGVGFVQSADSFGPELSNVAHAYALMRPGNQIVFFNAKEFQATLGNRDFPKDGRGDALGGLYGDNVTKLTNLRNTHGRGNYLDRVVTKESLVYERDKSAIVALSNRTDNGYDSVTVQTNFAPNTRLLEMTGNASNASVDPTGQVADFVVVDGTGKITFNLPRNRNINGGEHNKGYVIYGLPTPQGTLTIPDRDRGVAGNTPTAATNGTARLAALDVVTSDTFTIKLQTNPVVIGGYNDTFAGGDNAVFSINGGLKPDATGNDLNNNGEVDFRNPNSVVYGFEAFIDKRSPLVGGGDGEYRQLIDATKLVEGYNYLEVRAFRSRPSNEPAVYSSFKKIVYVDRLKAQSELTSITAGGGSDRIFRLTNADATADSVHVLLDTGSALSEAQTLALVGPGSQSSQIDTTLWSRTIGQVGTGNHTLSIVTYEPSGNYSVKRLTGVFIQTGRGIGVGDVNYDNVFTGADTAANTSNSFDTFLYSRGTQFNAASDVDANGIIDNRDLFALPGIYSAANATAAVTSARTAIVRRGNLNGDAVTSAADIDFLQARLGSTTSDTWLLDLNVDGTISITDVDTLVQQMLLTTYGDANLDRKVDFSDLLAVSQKYMQAAGWASGDFNGDGIVAFDDLLVISQNYNYGVSTFVDTSSFSPQFAADWALAQSLVPEPTTLLMLPAVLALVAGRRRRS